MIQALELIAANLGMGIENVIFIAVMIAGFILYAQDIRLGLLLQFVISSLCSIWFYAVDWDYRYAIITALITFTLMALSLLFVNKTSSGQGAV